jgi:F420-dependent oxidoreductase-like protein
MELCLMVSSQENMTWPQWVELAVAAEESGLAGVFTADHYLSDIREERDSLDAWALLAGLARSTSRVRLGTLVSPVTLRHPAHLAKVAATVDHISGGRIEVGVGAGWNEREHLAFGLPFPETGVRMEMLEEAVEVLRSSWTEDSSSFEGRHYRLDAVPVFPKPLQHPHPPLIVGGSGRPRTLRLAARCADEYDTLMPTVEECRERRDRLTRACEEAGRDPQSIRFSVMSGCVLGSDRADVLERMRPALNRLGLPDEEPEAVLAENSDKWVAGTVDEAVRRLSEFAELGVDRVYLQHLAQPDVETVRLIGSELVPAVSR